MKFSALTRRLDGLGSDKWAVHQEARQRQRAGRDIIMLSIGEPDFSPPAAVLDAADKAMRAGRTRYSNGRGEPEVLQAIARHYSLTSGRTIAPSQCTFLPGAQTGLFATMLALIDPGDEVLIADPYYATYDSVVAAAGGRVVPVPTQPEQRFHLTAEALAACITPRSRALLLNSPSNPTGAVLSRAEIEAIGAVCVAHDLTIICDEVYAAFTYGHAFASPLEIEALAERTIVISSISKTHALPGFRCGWAVGPQRFSDELLGIAEAMLFGSQPFLSDATAYALEHAMEAAVPMKAGYERRARLVTETLSRSNRIRAEMPEGGMFIMADIRATGMDGTAFAWKLLNEADVAVMPGESFGAGGAGHVRIGLTIDDALLAEACGRIVAMAERV